VRYNQCRHTKTLDNIRHGVRFAGTCNTKKNLRIRTVTEVFRKLVYRSGLIPCGLII
jgi:hypothetical protein